MTIPPLKVDSGHRAGATPTLIIGAFFRHQTLFFYTAFLTFALILSAALVTRKQYRSEMKFLVQNARSTSVISSDRTASSILNGVTEEQLNSEFEILQSEDVLSAVADPQWKPAEARSKSREEIRAHAEKLAKLTAHLTVDPIGKEDIMSLSYRADSPQEASDVLSAISSTYLARHEQLRRPTGASTFFIEQTALYESEWKSAVKKLVAFQQEHHLVSVPAVEDSLQRSILSDEEALRNGDLKLHESGASIGRANNILEHLPSRQQSQERTVPSEILLQQLKISLVGLGNRRTELLTRYNPTDRLVTELDQQIKDTSQVIERESQRRNVENTTDVNPAWQQLTTSMMQEQVNYNALKAGSAALDGQLAQLRAQLSDTQALAVTYDQLRSEADAAQSNYKTFVEKRDLAHAEDAMDQSKLLNVTVMESPTFPFAPSRPKPVLNLILGIPTAVFLAVAAVYFAETTRGTISTPQELDQLSDFPVLATVGFVSAYGDGLPGTS